MTWDTYYPAKDVGEVTLVGEASLQANLSQAHLRVAQHLLGSLQPSLQDVLMGARAGGLFEQLCEVKGAQPHLLRQLTQVDVARKIGLDVFQHPLQSQAEQSTVNHILARRSR